jgi:arsenate reductase
MKKRSKILFVCTHNRCRSVLGEVIANARHGDAFEAFSAGSAPAGEVHPLTLQYLQARGLPTEGLVSQSWQDFSDQHLDLVITVCDSAAKEACPLWMGETPRLHWGMPDPSRVEGPEHRVQQAFFDVMDALNEKLFELRLSQV